MPARSARLSSSLGQNITRDGIAGIRQRKHGWKQGREIRRWRGVCGQDQLLSGFKLPGFHQTFEHRRMLSLDFHPTHARAAATRCGRSSGPILRRRWRSPNHRRAQSDLRGFGHRQSNQYRRSRLHPGPSPKAASRAITMSPTTLISSGSIDGAFLARDYLRDHGSYRFADLGPGGACEANADSGDLRRLEVGDRAGLTDRGGQRLAGLRFADADHVASTSRPRAQDRSFVADQAGSLAAAAVDAEEDGHERSSIIRVWFLS